MKIIYFCRVDPLQHFVNFRLHNQNNSLKPFHKITLIAWGGIRSPFGIQAPFQTLRGWSTIWGPSLPPVIGSIKKKISIIFILIF